MSTQTIPLQDDEIRDQTEVTNPWQVILFDDNVHSIDEVIFQIRKATGCSIFDAERITLEAHNNGKALVFQGVFAECFKVAGILREIQLIVEIHG